MGYKHILLQQGVLIQCQSFTCYLDENNVISSNTFKGILVLISNVSMCPFLNPTETNTKGGLKMACVMPNNIA